MRAQPPQVSRSHSLLPVAFAFCLLASRRNRLHELAEVAGVNAGVCSAAWKSKLCGCWCRAARCSEASKKLTATNGLCLSKVSRMNLLKSSSLFALNRFALLCDEPL